MKSLWNTLPLEIQDLIILKSKRLQLQPVMDELVKFHRERHREYENFVINNYNGIFECVKKTNKSGNRTRRVQMKGGNSFNHSVGSYGNIRLTNRLLGFLTEPSGFYKINNWDIQFRKGMKQRLITHVKNYFPDYERIRKLKKFPVIEKCSNKQLMHILITHD